MFKFLKEFIKREKWIFISFIFFSFVATGISIYLPILNGRIIDILTEGEDIIELRNKIIIISSLLAFSLVLSYFLSMTYHKINIRIMRDINFRTVSHIRNLPLSFSNNLNTGYLTQRIIGDSGAISSFTVTSSRDFPLKVLTILFNVVILFKINVRIGLVLIVLIPLYILLFSSFKKKMYKSNKIYKEAESLYFGEMNSQMEKIKFIKVNALKTMFENSLNLSFSNFFDKSISYKKISTLFGNVGSFFTVCANILILSLGVREIFARNLTIGEFTVITTYFNMVINTVNYFLDFARSYQMTLVSFNRIKEILDKEVEKNGNIEIKDITKIEFKDLSFAFNNNKIFNNFNYTFEKGKVYRIRGNNGKGKSTLFNLILGLYDYDGDIFINDINLKEVNIYKMRRDLIAVVEQDLTIINGSVNENIKLNRRINNKDILDISEKLNANNLFEKDKVNFSGGEKQKINIIRNFARESKLLMLDEANSALDTESSETLKYMINKDKITLVISHNDIFDEIIDEFVEIK